MIINFGALSEPFIKGLTIKNTNDIIIFTRHKAMARRFSCPSFYTLPTFPQKFICIFPYLFSNKPKSFISDLDFILFAIYDFIKLLVSQCDCS